MTQENKASQESINLNAQDLQDLKDIAQNFTVVGRCSGGRLINIDGSYKCIICGADQDDGEDCRSPKGIFR